MRKQLFDADYSQGFRPIIYMILFYAVLVVVEAVAQYISQVHEWKTTYVFNKAIKKDYFDGLIKADHQTFHERSIGEYASIVSNDIEVLSEQYIDCYIDIIKSVIMIVIYAAFMIVFVDLRITIAVLLSSLVAVFAPKLTAKGLSRKRKIHQDQLGKYLARFQDLLKGHRLVTPKTQENIIETHAQSLVISEERQYEFGKLRTGANIVNGFVMDIVNITAFAMVGYLLYRGEITLGVGVATFGYIESFIYPIKYIINGVSSIYSTKKTKEKVLSYIERLNQQESETIDDFSEDIEFDRVTIAYDNFTLHQFSYRFEKGKHCAILGHSGSGKSTILNALRKYTIPSDGAIRIDGRDIGRYDVSNIISMLDQEEHTYQDDFVNNATVFNTYSKNHLTRIVAHLVQACKVTTVSALSACPQCASLSGGKKKTMHLIRSMLIASPILLLDEAFAAIDVNNAAKLKNAVFEQKDRTIIEVTHVLSEENLKYYDAILVMKGGALVASGSYSEMKDNEVFCSLKQRSA